MELILDIRCPRCGGPSPSNQRLNTMYENEESNWMYACDECYQEIYDHYEELWADYYSSRL